MLKVFSLFFRRFGSDPLRSRSDETALQHHAVLPHSGSGMSDSVEHFFSVVVFRCHQMIVQVTPRRINIRIAFIFCFQPLVVFADPADSTELSLFDSHDRVIRHNFSCSDNQGRKQEVTVSRMISIPSVLFQTHHCAFFFGRSYCSLPLSACPSARSQTVTLRVSQLPPGKKNPWFFLMAQMLCNPLHLAHKVVGHPFPLDSL